MVLLTSTDFFGSPEEVIVVVAGLVLGFCMAMAFVVGWYSRKIVLLNREIATLQAKIQVLQAVIIEHFPESRTSIHIDGDVSHSDLVAAGRDGGVRA